MEAFFFFFNTLSHGISYFCEVPVSRIMYKDLSSYFKKHNELLSSQLSPKPSGKCYLILLTPEVLLS